MRCANCGELATGGGNYCANCGAPFNHAANPAGPVTRRAPFERPLERRQLTIMFCDLVGSTALAEGMDPETFGELIGAHRLACAAPIERYEGVVARYLGDGMLVYFGYPEAHEDDPDRATRCGLEIVTATKALNDHWAGGQIAVRIGIDTGLVVVGDLRTQHIDETMAVFGRAPNLAARLQEIANPNTVVLSGQTRGLLRSTIRCRYDGETMVKGISEPIPVYEALEAVGSAHRARPIDGASPPAPLVGRNDELAALARRWAAARDGRGHAVLITGEAGIGKSRLIAAIKERITRDPCSCLATGTSPYATNTEFFAFAELIRGALQPGDRPRGAASDRGLRQAVAAYESTDPDMALGLAALLGIETPGDDVLGTSPERLRRLTLAAPGRWLFARAAEQPVVLVIEDLHWADASTLEAIDLLLADLHAHPVLLLMSSRSEPALAETARIETLDLDRLHPDDAQILLRHALAGTSLPQNAVDTLLERAGGVPLFIEELPKALVSAQRPDDPASANGKVAIPATLRDSLMARLDRMGGAKIVAQIGAILGHRFDVDLMQGVWDGPEETLHAGIRELVNASLLMSSQDPQSEQLEFKHVLIEEIAYDSLLRQDRRRYHTRAVQALQCKGLHEERPELVARHYSGAGETIAAFEAWLEAGKAAARRSAYKEALGYMNNAALELKRTGQAAQDSHQDPRWLDLLTARAPVLYALFGWADPGVDDNYRELLKIAERSNAGQEKFYSWRGIYNLHLLRGNLRSALEAAGRLREIALELADDDLLLSWHRIIGIHDFLAARFEGAAQHMEAGMASFDPAKHVRHTFAEGTRPAVIAHSIGAWALWFSGNSRASTQASLAALDVAERAEHPFSRAYAFCLASSLAQCRDHVDDALTLSEAALNLSMTHEFHYWRAWATMVKGWSVAALQDPVEGLDILKDGIAQYAATGAAQIRTYALCLLAETYARMGRWHEVIEAAESAINEARRSGIVFYAPEAHRLRGEGLCQIGRTAAGSGALLRAVHLADQQRSGPMLLRAALSFLHRVDRDRLRTIVAARTDHMLQRMERGHPASEMASARRAIAMAIAGAPSATRN